MVVVSVMEIKVCVNYKGSFPGISGAWEEIFDLTPSCEWCIYKKECDIYEH